MFLYRITRVQQLEPKDYRKWANFSQSWRDKVSSNYGFLCQIGFSDECGFHGSGFGNTQNCRILGTESKEKFYEWITQRKGSVWSAVYANGVVGPYFFNNGSVREGDNFQIAGHFRSVRSSTILAECCFQADLNSSSHYTGLLLFLVWISSKHLWIGRYGSAPWLAKINKLSLTATFPLRICKRWGVSAFSVSLVEQ